LEQRYFDKMDLMYFWIVTDRRGPDRQQDA
jgi:hypothetical protein